MTPRRTRWLGQVLAVTMAAMVVLLAVVPVLVLSLPDRVAMTWNVIGTATTTVSSTELLWWTLVLVVPTVLLMVVLVVGPWAGSSQRWRHAAWSAATFATWFAIWAAATAWINRGDVDASAVGGPAIWLHLVALAVMVGAGVAVDWMVTGGASPRREQVATLELAVPDSTEVSWTATVKQRQGIRSATSLMVSALIAGAFDLRLATMQLIASVATLATARLVVSVDERGVIVTRGLGFLPRIHIPLDQILSADPGLLHPKGWVEDLRLGPIRLPARSAVIREGPGMVVNLVDGGRFAVSLDDPYPATIALLRLGARPRDGQHSEI